MQRLAKHEAEDDEDDEYALSRVHDDAHPHALPPPRGIGGKDDVSQGGGDGPRLVQMVEAEEHPVGDEISPPKDAPHARQQSPLKSRSSPSALLKTDCTTITANQPQFPLKNSSPRVSRNRTRS